MILYVEGGGSARPLKTACRRGFRRFLEKAGFEGQMPRVVASGSRSQAYRDFCTATRQGTPALLLIDSESPIHRKHQTSSDFNKWRPWLHLANREGDGWRHPDSAKDQDCHFMVQCMESWFLADRKTLKNFFGTGFKTSALPASEKPIETVPKEDIFSSLKKATKGCQTKGTYGKGSHSFEILGEIDPHKIADASPWAKRFLNEMKRKMNA